MAGSMASGMMGAEISMMEIVSSWMPAAVEPLVASSLFRKEKRESGGSRWPGVSMVDPASIAADARLSRGATARQARKPVMRVSPISKGSSSSASESYDAKRDPASATEVPLLTISWMRIEW